MVYPLAAIAVIAVIGWCLSFWNVTMPVILWSSYASKIVVPNELQAVLFLRSPESSDMMQKLRRTRRPPARPECHPWIVTRLTCELQTSTKKTRRPGRCWSQKGTEGPAFRLVGAIFSHEANVGSPCLAGLWHSPSGRSWSGRGLLELCFFCISFAISESFVGKVATGHECWRRWQDQERQHQGPNIQCFLHHVHVVLICLPGGLRARKASWWQVWNGMNMYFFHVFNRQNAPYVLLFECFPLVYEATRIGASTLEVPEVQQLMAQRLCGDVS